MCRSVVAEEAIEYVLSKFRSLKSSIRMLDIYIMSRVKQLLFQHNEDDSGVDFFAGKVES